MRVIYSFTSGLCSSWSYCFEELCFFCFPSFQLDSYCCVIHLDYDFFAIVEFLALISSYALYHGMLDEVLVVQVVVDSIISTITGGELQDYLAVEHIDVY